MKKQVMTVAVSAALGLGMAGNVYADAYGISFDNIYGLQFGNSGAPGDLVTGTHTNSCSTSLVLNGVIGGSVCPGPAATRTDSPASNLGSPPTRLNNVFNFFGIGAGSGNWSNADGNVPTEQFAGGVLSGNPTQSITIAEANVHNNGDAGATSQNGSITGFSIVLTITAPVVVFFSGNAVPYMRNTLTSELDPGSSSQTSISASIDITNAAGASFLHFAPGALNLTSAAAFIGDDAVYDPTGCGTTIGAGTTCATPIVFTGASSLLLPGSYTLSLRATDLADVTAVVPEPATLALLGLGLLGLAGVGRKKQS